MSFDEKSAAISDTDSRQLLAIAKDTATAASELVRSHAPHALTFKGDRDVTSDVDLTVEKFVRDTLRKQSSGVGFLGEEEGSSTPASHDDLYWVLDPIDGTINFIHGVPLCAVSLSLVSSGRTLIAVIDLPFLSTQYSALRGNGSYVNNQKLHVSSTDRLNAALVSVDQFTFTKDTQHMNLTRYNLIKRLAPRVQRIRILGTSAIDLAWTAHGRLDVCIILGNKRWDTSAGVLIAREAGARVLDWDGSDHSANSSATIAVTPALEDDLMPILGAALAEVTPTPGDWCE